MAHTSREGFWRDDSDDETSHLPRAKEKDFTWLGQKAFLEALGKVEQSDFTEGQKFKGVSACRCCGEDNGAYEYTLTARGFPTWVWPEGYAHYIEVHNLRPSLAFQELILAVAEKIKA